MWPTILSAVIVGVAVVALLQYRAQKGTYRPLASRQPDARAPQQDLPLGMEAIDVTSVNRVNRTNAALERTSVDWIKGRQNNATRTGADSIEPMPDDETYAKRFHTAFMKNKSKD